MSTPPLPERLSRLSVRLAKLTINTDLKGNFIISEQASIDIDKALEAAHVAIGTNDAFAMSRAYNALAELLPQKETA